VLVELAVGDAYGAGFEYVDPVFVGRHNDLGGYVQHPTHLGVRPGSYTDDTQMTLAIAELLISGDPWNPENLADKFFEVFQRDPREGYASGFYQLLCKASSGAELRALIRPHSDKSGAAMRASPIGLLSNVDDVLRYAEVQAGITHDTRAGIESAQAAALMVHYCRYDIGPIRAIATWIEDVLQARGGQGGWDQPWKGRVGSRGTMSVRAALTALATCASLSDLLTRCVDYTGDVDTVATIALAAASCSSEITSDLPIVLLEGLENGPYGRVYLSDLDSKLSIS
jgi:ADP-ribosyl-[dinitrogen reductase] hydrolase